MNTLREHDGNPPKYPTVKDAEVPVLVSNQGRLLVSQKPASQGTINLMCSDTFVKLPYRKATQVRLSNNTNKDIAVINTWEKTILGNFDESPFIDGQTINGIDGWEGYGVTTPDTRDGDRAPIMDILQGRRSVLLEGKVTKAGPNKPTAIPDVKQVYGGSKISCLFRPRVRSKIVGLGVYDGSKNLVFGIYTENGKYGITSQANGDEPLLIDVSSSDIIRLELVFAPTTGFYKAFMHQDGKGRYLLSSGNNYSLLDSNLSYASYRVGAEGNGALVDEFSFFMLNADAINYEVMPTSTSSVFGVTESTEELMVKNLGSAFNNYTDKTDSVFLSGFYEES